jgi:hypothetical protein
VGQRIFLVGYQGYPDIYENARDVLDFQVSKKVLKSQAEIKLNIGDILNQSTVFYQNNTGDAKMAYDGTGVDRTDQFITDWDQMYPCHFHTTSDLGIRRSKFCQTT